MPKVISNITGLNKNYIINGNFDFWQRTLGTTFTENTSSVVAPRYCADRFYHSSGGAGVSRNYSIQRSTDVPTLAQSGFQSDYSRLFTAIGTQTFANAGDWVYPIGYRVEGSDYAKLHGKTVTLSFWVKASTAGVYNVAFRNSAGNRSYVTTFTVNSANQWEKETITLTLDSSGTWLFNEGVGLEVLIGQYAGTNVRTSNLNQWQAGGFVAANTSTDWMAAGATLRVAQVMLNEGSLAALFDRAGLDIGKELSLCQRYYEKSCRFDANPTAFDYQASVPAATASRVHVKFSTVKRASATITTQSDATATTGTSNMAYTVNNVGNYTDGAISIGLDSHFSLTVPSSAVGGLAYIRFGWIAEVEL